MFRAKCILESDIAKLGFITVEQDDDGDIIISDEVTLNYGVGKSFIEAVNDYYESLREWEILMKGETCKERCKNDSMGSTK